jgi:hypothetical protein
LQQHQQARILWCSVVGQGAQQQLVDVVHMDPADRHSREGTGSAQASELLIGLGGC